MHLLIDAPCGSLAVPFLAWVHRVFTQTIIRHGEAVFLWRHLMFICSCFCAQAGDFCARAALSCHVPFSFSMVSGSFCLCCGETQCEQLPKIQAGTTADEKKAEEKKATYLVDLSEDEVEVGSISATEPAAPALCGATAGNTRTQRRRAQRKKREGRLKKRRKLCRCPTRRSRQPSLQRLGSGHGSFN